MDWVPIGIFWCLSFWGFSGKLNNLVYLIFAFLPFGALSVVPPQLIGGTNIPPIPVIALLFSFRVLLEKDSFQFMVRCLELRKLGLLFWFWVIAILTTIFSPRLFMGAAEIVPMQFTGLVQTAQLTPTMQNITQMGYVSISVISTFTFAYFFTNKSNKSVLLNGVSISGIIICVTGLFDYMSDYMPISSFVDIFKNANYSIIDDAVIGDSKRIVGLMSEASAYGSMCVSILTLMYFVRRALRDKLFRCYIYPSTMVGLVLFSYLSTSSAAYAGLGVFALIATIEWLQRAFSFNAQRRIVSNLRNEAVLAIMGAVGISIMWVANPHMFDPIFNLVDQMIFQKSESSSFEERSFWTHTSLNALWETRGLGVGLGGTRASNAVVAVFSNVGIIGGTLYYSFLILSLSRSPYANDEQSGQIIYGLRWAFIPAFIMSLLIGTSADFGVIGGLKYGLLLALALPIRGRLKMPSLIPRRY